MGNSPVIDIYKYIDYRLFLKDYLANRKRRDRQFRQRAINEALGVSSSGFIANVIAGKNNLKIDHVKILGDMMRLSPVQAEYFKYMVYFGKSKSLDEKNDFYETMNGLRRKRLKTLSTEQLSLFSKWYYVVIRELLNFFPFKDDYEALAAMVIPPVRPKDAKEAVSVLSELGLIKKQKNGYFRQADNLVTTGDEVQSYHVVNFQLSMMDLEKNALRNLSASERDITGLTVTLSVGSFKKVALEISELRKRILKIVHEDAAPDQVYRCNFQVFPVSKKGRG